MFSHAYDCIYNSLHADCLNDIFSKGKNIRLIVLMMFFPAVYACSDALTHIHKWVIFTHCRTSGRVCSLSFLSVRVNVFLYSRETIYFWYTLSKNETAHVFHAHDLSDWTSK